MTNSDLRLTAQKGYELLDAGDGRKLERFGEVLIDRPSAQAIWPRDPAAPWRAAQASFERGEGGNGEWSARDVGRSESFLAEVRGITFELRLTGFGNVGLFPEHACHLPWMEEALRTRPGASLLNLFAYTGGASIAAARALARVTHVDAARAVNVWAKINADRAAIEEGQIRFLTDDAQKLVRREARRGKKYDAIVLDPPSFGRGAKGEVWKLERDLYPLLEACKELLCDSPLFVLLTAHSPGITGAVLRHLLAPFGGAAQSGEMLLAGKSCALPAGAYGRVRF